jgi:rhamnogalacturonyl hydrolase YesR
MRLPASIWTGALLSVLLPLGSWRCAQEKTMTTSAQPPKEESPAVREARALARRVAARVMKCDAVWGNYTLDLALEAMLELYRVGGEESYRDYVFSVVDRRGWKPDTVIRWEGQPFCHLNYKLYEVSDDKGYIPPFVAESARYRKEVRRSSEGLMLHTNKKLKRYRVLIDGMQDYTSRMARTGRLTGETSYFDECVRQYRLYREVLRNRETGLWSTGRGWRDDPAELSPGAWSRGHGWLIRGMVDSLCALPADSAGRKELAGYLKELADALLRVQDEGGMWHQLLHRSFDESYPDTSGTGLISYNLARAVHEGFLPAEPYQSMAVRAFEGLRNYVTDDGIVRQVCPGPGPLVSEADYLNKPGLTEDGHGHGPFAVLFACAGRILLEKAKP